MKTIKNIISLFLLMAIIAGCNDDKDTIYLYGHEESKLTATESNVVLSQDKSTNLVLSLVWSKSVLSVSNPDMSAPNIEKIYVQASTQSDFSSTVVEAPESSLSRSYTGAELNTLAKNLNMAADVATAVYFRIKSLTGNNMEPLYSNVVTVNITPFEIDMSVGFVLDSGEKDTGLTLISPQSNGVYTGFMGASGWYNFYLQEGDGTVWGNIGVDGNEFVLSSENSKWNCWFPGNSGCYFVEVNTVRKEWSALYIPTLNISGDVAGEMTFDRPKNQWYIAFNATKTGTHTINLQGTGKQYNASTKTSDAAAIDTPVAFAQASGVLTFGQSGNITVNVEATGESTLIIDLSDPNNWTCNVVSGSSGPDPVIEFLYLPGIDDNIRGGWTFDSFLSLYYEDEKAYAGVVDVNSAWGYSINIEKDNWDDKYAFADGDAYSGSLAWQGSSNLPSPTPGRYLIEVSLKNLTYNLNPIGDKIYLSGLNDVWDFNTSLEETRTPGVYKGAITITKAAAWGFQIHTDDSWSHKFGGSDGKLYYQGNNITDDASLEPGDYYMTVDLINMTYSIVKD